MGEGHEGHEGGEGGSEGGVSEGGVSSRIVTFRELNDPRQSRGSFN